MRFSPSRLKATPHIALSVRAPVAVVLVVLIASTALPGGAGLKEDLEELRQQQAAIQQDKQAKAQEVDVATAEATELSAALEALNAEVNEQAAKVSAAEQALVAAEARYDAAVQAVVEKSAEIEVLEGRLSTSAISSFKSQNNPRSPILEEADPNKAVRMQSLVESVTEDGVSVADELKVAKEDLELERLEASSAAAEAERIKIQLAEDLAELERRRGEQAALVEEAEDRLERELAEAWALSELDKELSDEIVKKNEELAAQAALARQRSSPAPVSRTSTVGFPSAADIVNVRGIWVHTDIAGNLEALLNQAESEGHSFTGGGYRDSQSQIRLRRAHCGTSDYAVYQMRSSQCRPPTARPGASQHEQGKAIDFRYNGSTISSRSNAGYQWLKANAAKYGLYNLPSEPWHWSVNGK
ncbi:MAG: D-alanyl-D-alanine carboxypeptidase family protein [Acidimicrobiales bacterium]